MFYVFSKPDCPFCVKAKSLLDEKGITYASTEITKAPEDCTKAAVVALWASVGNYQPTVPLILHNTRVVGGYTELLTYLSGGVEP